MKRLSNYTQNLCYSLYCEWGVIGYPWEEVSSSLNNDIVGIHADLQVLSGIDPKW